MSASRTNLIDCVAVDLGVSKADAKKAVESVLSSIEDLAFAHGSLTIREFGKFSARKRVARTVKSGVLDSPITVPERTALVFSCSKAKVRF